MYDEIYNQSINKPEKFWKNVSEDIFWYKKQKKLPKTRSGKVLRGTIRRIADKEEYNTPATIDVPEILNEIKNSLIENKIISS